MLEDSCEKLTCRGPRVVGWGLGPRPSSPSPHLSVWMEGRVHGAPGFYFSTQDAMFLDVLSLSET